VSNDLVLAKVSDSELVAERHAQLVSAATELFLQQGFHQTSVREIANAVGWQVGTLYLYISRKEDILYLISQSVMAEIWGMLERLPETETARAGLEIAARAFFESTANRRREIKLLYRESASLGEEHLRVIEDTELKERNLFAALVRRGIASGEFREVNADLVAYNIIMLAHMWALKGWALHESNDLGTYVSSQLEMVFGYLQKAPAAVPS
jgi:AcrR family transcriptional regulator